MSSVRTPTLAEVVTRLIEKRLVRVHTCMPARVERYDAEKQLVDVSPLLKEYRDPTVDDEDLVADALPVIVNVPVIFPGAGGFRVTFPVQVGDIVELAFQERSIDKWLEDGGLVDPEDARMHHLTDAVAHVGLHPNNQPWTGASTSHMTLGNDGGKQIHITASGIALGSESPTDAVALASKVGAALDALMGLLTGWTVLAGDGGLALKTAAAALKLTPVWNTAVGSSTVKVDP